MAGKGKGQISFDDMKSFCTHIGMRVLTATVRGLLCLRYRFVLTGLDDLKQLKGSKGILFLPNHPAELDPVMIMALLWNRFQPHPLVVEHFYYLKGFRAFMDGVGALPLPSTDSSVSQWKMKQVEKLFDRVRRGLQEGENYLIYPSGKLKRSKDEVLGGASFVHSLLQEAPDTQVVLVRTTGMWGSSFSRALEGNSPDFAKGLFKGFKILLKNGIFFAPRRTVQMDFSLAPADLPIREERLKFNQYLENWYNQKEDPLKLVSYSFWKEDLPVVISPEKGVQRTSTVVVPEEVKQAILSKLSQIIRRPASEISAAAHLARDLGLDSLDMAQLYVFLDERYETGEIPHGQLQTVEDLYIAAMGEKKEGRKPLTTHAKWPEEGVRPPVQAPAGKTIPEAFLLSCDRMGKATACADGISGALSYKRLKMAALALSEKIEKMEGQYIGVLLPSSVGAYLVILACMLAKKTPVMLNWTVGVRSLDHAVNVCDLRHVISSRKFLGLLDNVDLGSVDDRLEFMEEIRESLSKKDLACAWWKSLKKAPALMKTLSLDTVKPEDPAVILFTSGTESLPKAVPLSHYNILSNQSTAPECLHFKPTDILYGVLPPFHSFGFSITGLMPLLLGLKVCYAPDPNDSYGMAHDIAHWKATLFCIAPSFLRALFRAAKPSQLDSVRLFIVGAEKASQELFDYVAKLGAGKSLIEGYGITECSPVVTINRPEDPRSGVGKPLQGIELCTIDPATEAELPYGQEGEICICGPNVFSG
jgi:long-chain-fatty-acid--[acyl-carrier-protein] ligase